MQKSNLPISKEVQFLIQKQALPTKFNKLYKKKKDFQREQVIGKFNKLLLEKLVELCPQYRNNVEVQELLNQQSTFKIR